MGQSDIMYLAEVLYLGRYNIASVIFLPKISNLALIMRKHEISSHRGPFYKTNDLYFSKIVMSLKDKEKFRKS